MIANAGAGSNESIPMHNELSIRPATSGDRSAIATIAEATELFPGDMLPDMIAGYLDGSVPDIWLTVCSMDEPVAFAFCEPERMTNGTWNLLAIGVTPDRQSEGIGAHLLQRLEALLREAGHRVLLVETLGRPEFSRTRSFYLNNGFVEEACIRDFYEAGGDKIVFWKQL